MQLHPESQVQRSNRCLYSFSFVIKHNHIMKSVALLIKDEAIIQGGDPWTISNVTLWMISDHRLIQIKAWSFPKLHLVTWSWGYWINQRHIDRCFQWYNLTFECAIDSWARTAWLVTHDDSFNWIPVVLKFQISNIICLEFIIIHMCFDIAVIWGWCISSWYKRCRYTFCSKLIFSFYLCSLFICSL